MVEAVSESNGLPNRDSSHGARVLPRFVLPLLTTLLVGCASSRADLRPFTWEEGHPAQSADSILSASRTAIGFEAWRASTEITVVFVDRWYSTLLRGFTPLVDDDMRLELTYRRDVPGARLRTLDGSDVWTWAPRDGKPYFIEEEGAEDFWVGLYIESLRVYLEMPFIERPFVAAAGWAEWPGRWFQKVYFAESGPRETPGDQVVVWIDEDSHRPVVAEYTYRAIDPEYVGVLTFARYEPFGTVHYPREIAIGARPNDPRPYHRLYIERLELR